MGSLMSGWDAPIHDPQKVKSLTIEEIEAYWRSKKKIEEEHLTAISSAAAQIDRFTPRKGGLITRPPIITNQDYDSYMDQLINKDTCWWTHSNSAFLNEPPVMGEGSKHNYKSQHRVASGFASTTNVNPDTRITI